MIEVRLARAAETAAQKEIWKLCFGDPDSFIDLYYTRKYRPEETVLLLADGVIAAMLAMLPVQVSFPEETVADAAMLYAVATHPQYQKKGLAGKLLEFTGEYLKENNQDYSVLVPATGGLFDFYRKLGYQDSAIVKEITLRPEDQAAWGMPTTAPVMAGSISSTVSSVSESVSIHPATPRQYLETRESLLEGRLHISYPEEVIAYQKLIAQYAGADIFILESGSSVGCAVVERYSAEKSAIKDFLCPPGLEHPFLRHISEMFPAREYSLRVPAFSALPGTVRPFAMSRVTRDTSPCPPCHSEALFNRASQREVSAGLQQESYLGLALD